MACELHNAAGHASTGKQALLLASRQLLLAVEASTDEGTSAARSGGPTMPRLHLQLPRSAHLLRQLCATLATLNATAPLSTRGALRDAERICSTRLRWPRITGWLCEQVRKCAPVHSCKPKQVASMTAVCQPAPASLQVLSQIEPLDSLLSSVVLQLLSDGMCPTQPDVLFTLTSGLLATPPIALADEPAADNSDGEGAGTESAHTLADELQQNDEHAIALTNGLRSLSALLRAFPPDQPCPQLQACLEQACLEAAPGVAAGHVGAAVTLALCDATDAAAGVPPPEFVNAVLIAGATAAALNPGSAVDADGDCGNHLMLHVEAAGLMLPYADAASSGAQDVQNSLQQLVYHMFGGAGGEAGSTGEQHELAQRFLHAARSARKPLGDEGVVRLLVESALDADSSDMSAHVLYALSHGDACDTTQAACKVSVCFPCVTSQESTGMGRLAPDFV